MTPHPALDALRPPEDVTPGPWRFVCSWCGQLTLVRPNHTCPECGHADDGAEGFREGWDESD